MKHFRLLVALALLALGTAAMACDDDDEAPPERANVVQALLDGAAQPGAAQHA